MARLLVMAGITILLLIPLSMVQAIVSERATRRAAAVQDISGTWGAPQLVGAIVLSVPYTKIWPDGAGGQRRAPGRAYFLPREIQIDGALDTSVRRRGIFDVTVYSTSLAIRGRFVRPDVDWIRPVPEEVHWDQAVVTVGVSDPRGLVRRTALEWGGRQIPFVAGSMDAGLFKTGMRAAVPNLAAVDAGADIPFALTIDLRGTHAIRFLPAAEEVAVSLRSTWPHPSFTGTPLPATPTTEQTGFFATWRVTDFARAYPARWTGSDVNIETLAPAVESSAFGVNLVQPADIYQQAERAVKYAVLFIVLTFLVFFLWEIFQAALVHPVQYVFVGFALCLFYLLLVSLSEHTGFDRAYAVSSVATTLMIAGYSRAVLRGTKPALSVAAALGGLYGFLYLLLRLEDYALLAGTVGLFLILAFVMYVTRRMDWYNLKLGTAP